MLTATSQRAAEAFTVSPFASDAPNDSQRSLWCKPDSGAALGVSHEALNRTMGERVRGDLHVQTVNSRHSRLKDFLRPRRGIATRYLDNYLSWFHLVGLAPGANDRACLAAAVTR